MGKRIAILQPEVPHYRTEFFLRLENNMELSDIYVYHSQSISKSSGFNINENGVQVIPNKVMKGFLLYNPALLLQKEYNTLVLMLNYSHITTWLLLLTKRFHNKKIVLWGQGISVKRYLEEEKKPDWKVKAMIRLCDGVMLYTEKEYEMWKKIFPEKKMTALNNTLTGVKEMVSFQPTTSKEVLKEKYGIKEKKILIFCARFESNYRRVDLLLETMERLDSEEFGFIIIGTGKNKPDFSKFKNVHDFGAVFDDEIKKELFEVADIYFQPGWVGLSIVEAMAYGKPVFTFRRSNETKQCVEYSYIKPGVTGLLFDNMDDCVKRIQGISTEEISILGNNARNFVKNYLTIENMVNKATMLIESL